MKNHHHNGPHLPTANSRSVIHETIAARAYDLWLQDGKPEDQADAHWLQAEREMVAGRRESAADPVLPVSF